MSLFSDWRCYLEEVQERTALLDKIVFGNIQILQFADMKDLIDREIVEVSTSKVKYVTASGEEFSTLLIEQDGVIDKMKAGSMMSKGKKVDYCSLETTVGNEEFGNLYCYTFDDYIGKLMTIQDHLEAEYGIVADLSDMTVKAIEINRTFRLSGDF